MRSTAARSAALVGAVALAGSMFTGAPAQSEELESSHVTARASDTTPASGETFRITGALWSDGERQAATVKVKTFRGGEWVQLRGAVMDTNRYNRYTIRVRLQMEGQRTLRVVAIPKDDDIARARKDLTVTVH